MSAALSEARRMFAAFAYLQATSTVNAVWQRLRRLRQPKYLFGALFAVAYFYAFFFRRTAQMHGGWPNGFPPQVAELLTGIGAVGLLLVVLASWLVPSDRAAIRFSEAEVAFLFPAPLSRVGLINFSLLRAQLGLFLSAFLMSLLFGRGRMLPGNPWQHATSLWLMLATLRLHFIGASFAHERLFELGFRPWLRRALVAAVALLLLGLCWWWLGTQLAPPTAANFQDSKALLAWAGTMLATPPLAWLLAPFRLLSAPLFAFGTQAWLRALGPALLLLLLHYLWVLRSQVSFEEASIDFARRRAERVQAVRDGKSPFRHGPGKPRSQAFALKPRGFAPVAFLWKGLIAAGPFWRLRSWLIACAILVAGIAWLGQDPLRKPILVAIAGVAMFMSGWLVIVGPMLVQRGLRETLEHLDILKAGPLHGWQIALGQLFTPVLLICAAQWLLLLAGVLALHASGAQLLGSGLADWLAAVAGALLLPPLCALMLCIPFSGLLFFPAWAAAMGGHGGGVEVAGQRMIFFFGYVLTLAAALLPATLIAGAAYWLVSMLAGQLAALLLATLLAIAVVLVELGAAVWWLGARIDRFDVSQELR